MRQTDIEQDAQRNQRQLGSRDHAVQIPAAQNEMGEYAAVNRAGRVANGMRAVAYVLSERPSEKRVIGHVGGTEQEYRQDA